MCVCVCVFASVFGNLEPVVVVCFYECSNVILVCVIYVFCIQFSQALNVVCPESGARKKGHNVNTNKMVHPPERKKILRKLFCVDVTFGLMLW